MMKSCLTDRHSLMNIAQPCLDLISKAEESTKLSFKNCKPVGGECFFLLLHLLLTRALISRANKF